MGGFQAKFLRPVDLEAGEPSERGGNERFLLVAELGDESEEFDDADQFVVLLTDTSRLGAELVMLRVRERLASARIRLYEEEVPLRFAWGASVLQKGMDLPALLREAELDLLRNKTAREATAKSAGM